MKKRIYSILSMFLIALTCVLASACGNKYGKMKFQVLYAYSADAKTWHDGTDGIFIAYGENDELIEGEEQSSLIFGENNQASLFIKVKIKNVKSKHLGSIAMSFASVSGLEFAPTMISRNKAIEVPISKDVRINTALKLHESNSGKSFSTSFKVAKRLESMSADLTINPAMFSTSTLNLANLTNDLILYNPDKSETNETGVKYSIGGIGNCTVTGFSETHNAEQSLNFVDLTDNVLQITDASFVANSNAIKIVATSIFHDGVKNPDDLISTEFYVYVVKTFTKQDSEELLVPTVKFAETEDVVGEEIHLYENGGAYETSTLKVDLAGDVGSIPINTYNGTGIVQADIGEFVYVKSANGSFTKYNFVGENQQEGINGLSVYSNQTDGDVEQGSYKFAIFDRNVQTNIVKIAYEFEGLNFSYSDNCPVFEKNIVVNKLAVPRYITLNDVLDLKHDEKATGVIYITSSQSYEGLYVKVNANPTTDANHEIKISKSSDLITVSDKHGNTSFETIPSGASIIIRLEDGATGNEYVTFETLSSPSFYNGKTVVEKQYIKVKYNIQKVVTANELTFVAADGGELSSNSYIKAQGGGYVYLKANYSGTSMDGSTVKLISNNDSIVFANGTKETTLNDVGSSIHIPGEDYLIYKVQIKSPNAVCVADINAIAAEGAIGVSAQIKVESVNVASSKNVRVSVSSEDAVAVNKDGLSNCFLLANSDFAEFKVDLISQTLYQTNAVKKVELQRDSAVNSYVKINTISTSTIFTALGIGCGTNKFTVKLDYFTVDDYGNVVIQNVETTMQIAVFNPIKNINVSADKQSIAYVSAYYEEVGTTNIKYKASTFVDEVVSNEVKFENVNGEDVIVDGVTGVKVAIATKLPNLNSDDFDGLASFQNKTYYDEEETLTLTVKNDSVVSILDKLQFRFTAVAYGTSTSVSKTIEININKVNKATGIEISGEDINVREDNQIQDKDMIDDAKINMSFMKIADDGYAEAEFDAKILFDDGTEGIKLGEVNKDLTYIAYEYRIDGQGKYIQEWDNDVNAYVYAKEKLPRDFFNVELLDGKINVKAFKEKKGGIFQLVLATKDSYNQVELKAEDEIGYKDFNKIRTITIEVEDGEKHEYHINKASDLKLINTNLDKKFALYDHIVVEEDLEPLGYVNGGLVEFTGSLSGTPTGSNTQYSITQTLRSSVKSTSYGDVSGLFGIVGQSGIVENLTYIMKFKSVGVGEHNFKSESQDGLKIGGITAVNLGTIQNIKILTNSGANLRTESQSDLCVGGIAGLNKGIITKSSVINELAMQIDSTAPNVNVGLIAGRNENEIIGTYQGKDDLTNYVFDVISNLIVKPSSKANVAVVAGENVGQIKNLLIGGKIELTANNANLGGFAGKSSKLNTVNKNPLIDTCVALSLDLTNSNGVVGGVVAEANNVKINYVKFVSAETEFTFKPDNKTETYTRRGVINGNVAGGVVGRAGDSVEISESSVESFIDDATVAGNTVGGLVASGEANIENSFVKANLHASTSGVYTSAGDLTNVYYVGTATGSFTEKGETYCYVESQFDLSDYMISREAGSIVNWDYIYRATDADVNENTQFVKAVQAEALEGTWYYYELNVTQWANYITKALISGWSTVDGNATKNYDVWEIQGNYNTKKVNGVDLFLPYLLKNGSNEPLMIVEPKYISASINENYVTKKDSDKINDYHDTKDNITIAESVVVNFFKDAGEEVNSYALISEKNEDNGLLDITLLPENAQGGYGYRIKEGGQFAYINNDRKLVIINESGCERILIEVYSVFNPQCKTYVAIYSQCLLTEVQLNSNKLEKIDSAKYETSLFVGQEDLIVSLEAVNQVKGAANRIDYVSILDVLDSDFDKQDAAGLYNSDTNTWNLVVKVSSDKTDNSILKFDSIVEVSDFANISFAIKAEADLSKIVEGYHETITLSLCLRKEYFANSHVKGDVEIGYATLVIYPYNSAEAILVNGDDIEMFSKDEMSFDVFLKTQAVPADDRHLSEEKLKIENLKSNNGLIIIDEQGSPRDSIRVEFEIDANSESELTRIKSAINAQIANEDDQIAHFTELFDINIYRKLYKAQDETTVLGFQYNFNLMLKNERLYRALENSINFKIKIVAKSNPSVNNGEGLEVEIKPTQLSTVRMESYAVTEIKYNTDYSEKIIENDDKENNVIQPGSAGNLMMIYLEPSYSQVKSIKIKSSIINVPKLGDTMITFSQLIYDETKPNKPKFTTLYGANVPNQNLNVLELNKVTTRKGQIENYTGVIYVWMQLPRFAGIETTITVSLEVETANNVMIEQSKDLITACLPDTSVSFDEDKLIKDSSLKNAYYIQKGTSNNQLKITVVGYDKFESNPDIKISWDPESCEDYLLEDNDQIIKWKGEEKYVGNYIKWELDENFDAIKKDESNNSYTLTLNVEVTEDLIAPIKLSVEMSLYVNGSIVSGSDIEGSEDDYVVLWPTDYLITSYGVNALSNGRKNVAINSSSSVDLYFKTENDKVDYSDKIFELMTETYKTENGLVDKSEIASLFKFYKEEVKREVDFSDASIEEFTFDVVTRTVNGDTDYILQLFGVAQFKKTITLTIPYYYVRDGLGYKLRFKTSESLAVDYGTPLATTFELNVFAVNSQNEIPIYTAEEIYDSKSGKWNLVEGVYYVLMNDIELENVVPITTKIGQLDGNNRIISIKSFKIDDNASEYGLFANIGTYTVKNPISEKEEQKQTILKNVIVDYGKLIDGTIPLSNVTTETLSVGGLVGTNNGGLIYNCDVVNTNTNTAVIDVIVPLTAHVKFGGLVGDNAGIITNSRVGTSSYERVTVMGNTLSQRTIPFGGLTFKLSHNVKEETGNNFKNDFAGFAGVNSGTISNSFVTRTNLINYSTNEQLNNTAGFVATNNGVILSSYVKSDEQSISMDSPRSKGYGIEQKGNGIVAGFVYANNGSISNSYANVVLTTKSAYISGFVYTNSNSGTISESYSASTMNSGSGDNNAEQPFIGVDNAGELLSFGTMKNSYYLMRSTNDNPYTQGDKPVAHALNEKNFQIADNLTNFAFVLGNSVTERKQGIWSYYTLENKRRILPEIMSANYVAFSFRIERTTINKTTGEKETVFTPVSICAEGTQNNPFTISNVEEYNKHFTLNNTATSRAGYFRLINNISFLNNVAEEGGSQNGEVQGVAVYTRTDYVLGSDGTVTSFEGNGLTISDIYLDVEVEEGKTIESIGLFAEINNAYIKNVNLKFATSTANGQFSTTKAIYSGGLAGKISDSAIMNINITGNNTTLVGQNFVGGLAGLIDGKSLIYGVESSVNVKSENTGARLFYNKEDYDALNVSKEKYDSYLQTLSYAGGIAGILDFEQKDGVEYNIQSVSVRGDLMSEKVGDSGVKEPNIMGQFSGGVAGYASSSTNAIRLNYVMGKNEWIYGEQSVGGLFGVSLGRVVASQVSADEEDQYEYDTEMGKYFIQIAKNKQILMENSSATITEATLNENAIGNTSLLHSENNVGGLIGIGLGAVLHANYSKATVKDGSIVGGLIGLNVASDVTYSYAVVYVNSSEKLEEVGGLFGMVCPVKTNGGNTNLTKYSKLIEHETNKTNKAISSIKFTYSTVVVDETFKADNVKNIDYVAGNYKTETENYLSTESAESLRYVYAGIYSDKISNNTKQTNNALVCEAYELYNLAESVQELTFNDVFSAWSIVKYWSLDHTKYLPLLTTKVVDNFIIIDEAEDFKLIENNPEANYKIVKDITVVDIQNANWIIDCGEAGFSGILLGEKEADLSRPKVTIYGLNPQTSGQTSGFINKCDGAKISNIEIVWAEHMENNLYKPSINLENVDNLTYVSGFVCADNGSLISNVLVRSEKEILNTNNQNSNNQKQIQGFGGIVGFGCNTSILSCEFAGQVTANLSNVNLALMVGKSNVGVGFGGIAGVLVSSYEEVDDEIEQEPEQGETGNEDETDTEDTINMDTAMISGCNVGASKARVGADSYPQTKFNITTNSGKAYIGGVVGRTVNVAIATTSIGGLGYEDAYKKISLDITLQNSNDVYVGGLGGWISEGVINSITDLIDIKLSGSGQSVGDTIGSYVNVGGIAGRYSLAALKSLSTGVRKSSVQANIVADGLELIKSVLNISTGFGQLANNAKVEQCLFDGSVNTNIEDNNLPYVNAGSIAGWVTGNAYIQEVITKSEIYAGEKSHTEKLYVGGFVGDVDGMLNIESSATWGRIVPITSQSASEIFAGGFVGKASGIKVSNSYSLTSVVMSMMANSAIKNLNAGALVGKIETEDDGNNAGQTQATSTNIFFNNVYYSSDIALCVDENYDENDNPIGTNLAAYAMLVDTSTWSESLKSNASEVWTTFSGTRIPHVSALTDTLQNYGIVMNNAYKHGSVMNPKIIISTGEVQFDAEYTYYIINTDSLPTFTNPLSGVLIGSDIVSDNVYGHRIKYGSAAFNSVEDINSATGIIAHVKSDSAVSNLHINLGNDKSYNFNGTTNNGFIAGKNEGVIFNCSVQGSLVKIVAEGSRSVGLIAGNNSGLISHSYSSAEISTEDDDVIMSPLAGITFTNSGKLLSNYFTGYLNSSMGSAGIFMSEDSEGDEGYLYNNYMGGVVVETALNAFAGLTFEGSNNYIDKYSDVSLASNANLISITTAELMKNIDDDNEQYLTGRWVTVLNSDGTFEQEIEQGKTNPYFGRNYNYPTYRFNKMAGKSQNEYSCIDYQKQLKTGNGQSNIAKKSGNFSLAERYKALTELDSGYEEYTDAFKILHYGILQSVHALLDKNRNYVLMYDVDATITTDGSVDGTLWTAIGSGGEGQEIDGFVKKKAIGFNGVFVTNRHFSQSSENAICSISGLSGQGLFDNINNAYIGKINLGSFYKLQASGAIGVKVGTENANTDGTQSAETANNVFVDSIKFVKGSEISSVKFDPDQSESSEGIPTPDADDEVATHYGALFGSINNTHVNISNFASASSEGSSNLVLKGSPYDTVGLIAGKSTNSTITFSALEGEMNNENKLIALFRGNGFAGGLIGHMTGGTLDVGNNVVHLAKFDDTGSAEVAVSENNVYYTNVLGGIVGVSSSDGTSDGTVINNANVKFYSSKHIENNFEEVDVYANSFGGFVGYVQNGKLTLTGASVLDIQGKAINFNVSSSAQAVYCGLVVGCSMGTTEVASLQLSPKEDNPTAQNSTPQGRTFVVRVKKDANSNATTQSNGGVVNNNIGIGSFVGCQSGSLTITEYRTEHIIQLESEGVPNLGGIVGCYYGGDVKVDLQSSRANIGDNEPFFILIGTENVGGIAGYAGAVKYDAFRNSTKEDNDGKNLLALNPDNDKAFSLILVRGSEDVKSHKNFGGLFGSWGGTITGNNGGSSDEETGGDAGTDTQPVVNNINTILIGSGYGEYKYTGNNTFSYTVKTEQGSPLKTQNPQAMNIGGIAGTVTNVIGNLSNYANIKSLGNETDDMVDVFGTGATTVVNLECKLLNVGGIVGLATGTVKNSTNYAKVFGYQNVGGIAGGVSGNVDDTIDTNISKGFVKGAINVGGIVGYASGSTISNNKSLGSVYGNTNVGGLIGLSKDAKIENNQIGPEIEEDGATAQGADELEQMKVSGVTYTRKLSDSKCIVYIPTSVGGLVGTVKNSENRYFAIEDNTLTNLNVTSTKEGLNQPEPTTISVIKNNMVPIADLSTAKFDSIFEYNDDCVVKFKETYSGYGGFIGTIDLESILDVGANNEMGLVNINPTYGINVGSFYGAYTQTTNDELSNNPYPKLTADVKVAGSYNVGGIIGYQHTLDGKELKFKQYGLPIVQEGQETPIAQEGQETPKIHVQDGEIGIYVGGLIGKTDAETIEGLTLDSTAQIQLYTNKSYYIGGLIGQAQVDGDTTFEDLSMANSGIIASDHDDKANFGAFIGLLKVGANSAGLKISVNGTHNEFFTINAIESCNYANGESYFTQETQNKSLYLRAQAYYINKDRFDIVGSKTVSAPFGSAGWAYDYTTTRIIQRCIPAEQNNNEWDAVSPIYDAKGIKRVTTKVSEGKTTIEATCYEEEKDQIKKYTTEGVYIPLYDREGNPIDGNASANDVSLEIALALMRAGYSTKNPFANGFSGYQGKNLTSVLLNGYNGKTFDEELDALDSDNTEGYQDLAEKLNEVYKSISELKKSTNKIYFDKEQIKKDEATKQYYALAIPYQGGYHAKSGSLFEVAGKAPDTPTYNAYSYTSPANGWNWFWGIASIVLIVGIIVAWVAVSIWTGGSGFTAGPAVALVVSKIATGAAVLLGLTFAAVAAYNFSLINTSHIQNSSVFLSTPNQSVGFLSSSYTRKITYQGGELQNFSDDAYADDNGNMFQPYSYDRMNEFRSKHYYKLPLIDTAKVTDDGEKIYKLTQIQNTTDNDKIDINALESLNTKENTSLWIQVKEGTDVEQTFNYVVFDGSTPTHVIVPRFLFAESQYWMNTTEMEMTYVPYTATFVTPTTVDEEGTNVPVDHLYMSTGTGNYIYGKYENGKYTFYKGEDSPNYIKEINDDNDGKITATITYPLTTTNGDSFKTFENVTLPSATATQELSFKYTTANVTGVNGYECMEGVYYGKDGDANFANASSSLPVKYANYSTTATENGERPDGKEWYDYITKTTQEGVEEFYELIDISDTKQNDDSIQIYPQSFTENPYVSTAGDNSFEEDVKFTIVGEDDDTSKGVVTHQATYFYCINGVVLKENADGNYEVYTIVENTADTQVTVKNDKGEYETITLSAFENLEESITDYKLSSSDGKEIPLSELYCLYGNNIYEKLTSVNVVNTGKDKGLLVEVIGSYPGVNDQYAYGKYRSNKDPDFYTRYKFGNNIQWNMKWKDPKQQKDGDDGAEKERYYRLICENGETIPNIGFVTYFSEVVKVSLTGLDGDYVIPYLNGQGRETTGYFKVKS